VQGDERDTKTQVFKGLAIPDKEPSWENEESEDENNGMGEDRNAEEMDDTFAMLESLAGKAKPPRRQNGASRKRSISPYDDRMSKRRRSKSRSRERRREKPIYKDEFGGTRESRRDLDRSNNRRRHHSDSEDDFRRPPELEIDDTAVVSKVYRGRVTGIKDFGVFVNLHGVKGRIDGLVHVSAMQEGARINHPSDLVSRNQEVYVKVTKVENNRISLSMKEVDQVTGRDLAPHKRLGTGANTDGLRSINGEGRYGNLSSDVPVIEDSYDDRGKKQRKRLTSPERWEIKQLIASGAISRDEYPDIDDFDNQGVNEDGEFEEEEDVDIEVREDEPPFLAGQTKQSLELSPIRIVKAPDGSLNRAAISGESLAKERRELRQQEAQDQAAKRAAEVDLSSQWNDPMAAPDQRKFAGELRSARAPPSNEPTPIWKRIAMGQEKTVAEQRASMSIKEQRESLPIFKFRKQLLEAIKDNQILLVIGETGSGTMSSSPQQHSFQLTSYFRQDNTIDPIPSGKWLRERTDNWMHPTKARCCHECCKTSCRRSWLQAWSRSWLHDSI
jgi:ATP-dependent RNA helicase DHX8/PRP22